MKKYGAPFLVIVLGSLLLYLENVYAFVFFQEELIQLTIVVILFVMGAYMSQRVGRKGWVKKLFVLTATILLVLIQMGILHVEVVDLFLDAIHATSLIYYLLYLYLGYLFF